MSNKIFVGNLTYTTSEEELKELFSECGELTDCKLITDRETGRSRGFAFLTFAESKAVDSAIELNGKDIGGRNIRVNKAEEKFGR